MDPVMCLRKVQSHSRWPLWLQTGPGPWVGGKGQRQALQGVGPGSLLPSAASNLSGEGGVEAESQQVSLSHWVSPLSAWQAQGCKHKSPKGHIA